MRYALPCALWLGLALMSQGVTAASLTDLLMQVPEPPADGAAAALWVRQKQIVAPEFLKFETQLRQQQGALAKDSIRASAAVADSPAVLAAVRGYESYRAQNSDANDPSQLLGQRSGWLIKRFNEIRPHTDVQWLTDHNLVDDELKAWRGLFRDWRSRRRGGIEKADRELHAAADSGAIGSAQSAAALEAYRAAMLREIDIQLSITRLAIERFVTPR